MIAVIKAEERKQSLLAPLGLTSAIVKFNPDQVSDIIRAEERKQSLIAPLGLM